MSARRVTVVLTRPQLAVLMSLCGYAHAGGPDDVSMTRAEFDTVGRAHRALQDALDDHDAPRRAD